MAGIDTTGLEMLVGHPAETCRKVIKGHYVGRTVTAGTGERSLSRLPAAGISCHARYACTRTDRKRHPRFQGVMIYRIKDPGATCWHCVSEIFKEYNLNPGGCGAMAWSWLWPGECGWQTDFFSSKKV
jgi:hypothetical protein